MKKYNTHATSFARLKKLKYKRLFFIFVLIVSMGMIFYYAYHERAKHLPMFVSSLQRFKYWVATHQFYHTRPQKPTKPIINTNIDQPPPIHFEFYTTLPTMKFPNPLPEDQATITKITPKTTAAPEETLTPPKTTWTGLSADELAQEISKQFIQHNYIVQLAAFHSSASAMTYLKTLNEMGINAKITKMTMGAKNIFRVQMGPYITQEEAKNARNFLLQKGVKGLIKKIG